MWVHKLIRSETWSKIRVTVRLAKIVQGIIFLRKMALDGGDFFSANFDFAMRSA